MKQGTGTIRGFEPSDMDEVLDIWLKASIEAHGFVESEFWESRIDDMRETYIPSSDTYVFVDNKIIKGFLSLRGEHTGGVIRLSGVSGQGYRAAIDE